MGTRAGPRRSSTMPAHRPSRRSWRSPTVAAVVVAVTVAGLGPSSGPVASGGAALLATTIEPPSTTEPAGTSVAPSTEPAGSTATVERGIRDVLTEAFADERGGAIVHAVRDGRSIELGVGERNAGGEPMTPATPFRIGSLTKTFVATMVLQLVDEGRVDLDAPLGDYLPDSPAGVEVTIRDLLRHRSGIPEYVRGSLIRDLMTDRARRFEPADVLASIEPIIPGPAGGPFAYSNTNYVLLGQLIEQVDGVDLNTALRARLTEPLGLDVTRFDLGEAPSVAGLASAWSPGVVDGDPDQPFVSIASAAWAAGAIVSTAGELVSFLTALFNGELVSAASLEEMTDVEPGDYGLGLGSGEFRSGHPDYGHGGEIFGYLSFMAIQPDTGDIVVLLVNNDQIDFDELLVGVLSIAW